jgi:hypothetical protein
MVVLGKLALVAAALQQSEHLPATFRDWQASGRSAAAHFEREFPSVGHPGYWDQYIIAPRQRDLEHVGRVVARARLQGGRDSAERQADWLEGFLERQALTVARSEAMDEAILSVMAAEPGELRAKVEEGARLNQELKDLIGGAQREGQSCGELE